MSQVAKVKKTETRYSVYDLELLKNTVAKGASDDELKLFVYLCNEYSLDPLKKEIYFLKYAGRTTIITSRDGYLKIANCHDQFDGIESDVVYQGDKLTKRDDGSLHIEYSLEHLAFDKAKLSGAFCSVFRKDRKKATTVFVSLKDYFKKDAPIWGQYVHAMILKVAEAMALKRAFSISGLVTREEIEKEHFEADCELTGGEELQATEAQRKALFSLITTKNISEATVKELMLKQFNKQATKDLTKDEVSNLIAFLNTR
jgi:phage recombination protein Bet